MTVGTFLMLSRTSSTLIQFSPSSVVGSVLIQPEQAVAIAYFLSIKSPCGGTGTRGQRSGLVTMYMRSLHHANRNGQAPQLFGSGNPLISTLMLPPSAALPQIDRYIPARRSFRLSVRIRHRRLVHRPC